MAIPTGRSNPDGAPAEAGQYTIPLTGFARNFLRFFKLKSGRRLLLEAVFWLGISRLAILLIPFRRIAPHLGRHMLESTDSITPDQQTHLRQLADTIRRAARNLPWECKCLAQAMAGKAMLSRQGIPSTLYLGLAKDPQNALQAHAWLRAGGLIVTGGRGCERYVVVAYFGE